MKKNLLYGMLLLAAGLTTGCTDNIMEQMGGSAQKGVSAIVANIPAFIPADQTRLSVDPETYAPLNFESYDVIGAYFKEGDDVASAAFTLNESAEFNEFKNHGFNLNPNGQYYAFYPYDEKATAERAEMYFPGSYYMATPLKINQNGTAEADFKHLTTSVMFDLQAPTGFYNKLVICASGGEKIAVKGVYKMKKDEISLVEKKDSVLVSLNSTNLTISHITTSIQMAPQDLSKTKLTFHFYDTEDNMFVAETMGVEFKQGYSYKISAKCELGRIAPATIQKINETALFDLVSMEAHNWSMGFTSLTNTWFADMLGNDAYKGSNSTDQPPLEALQNWNFTSDNDATKEKWNSCYKAMKDANALIMATTNLSGYEVGLAEGKFLRAFFGFEALRVFGASIPYITEEDYAASENPIVSNKANGSYVYIWDKIVKDLKEAIEVLPDTATGNHITKWAAKAVLAKVYVYWSSPYNGGNGANANRWADAQTQLNDIISSGRFGLVVDYASIFRPAGDNSKECVFEIQHTTANGKWQEATLIDSHSSMPQFVLAGWGFYSPSYDFVNSFIVNDDGLPDSNFRSKSPLTTTPYPPNFTCDNQTPVDPRLDITVGRLIPTIPYLDYPAHVIDPQYIRDISYAGPYFPKKYVPDASENGSINDCASASEKNLHAIRYADILLMAAEVAIHQGDLTKAQSYINQVRSRAANSAWWLKNADGNNAGSYRVAPYGTPFASVNEATVALQREYRLEFGMEGHRWFDLTRWGVVSQELNASNTFDVQYVQRGKPAYNDNWICLPIPQTAINSSKGALYQGENWQ